MTYPEAAVAEIVNRTIPVQLDNTKPENDPILKRYHHIWTPDIRLLNEDGDELYSWQGYLPPAEFAARTLAGLGQAHLRLRNWDQAEAHYVELLKRFPTAQAAPEAQYYLGVTRYRRDPGGNELLHQWAMLRAKYPDSEFRLKQSFKELP